MSHPQPQNWEPMYSKRADIFLPYIKYDGFKSQCAVLNPKIGTPGIWQEPKFFRRELTMMHSDTNVQSSAPKLRHLWILQETIFSCLILQVLHL